MIYDLFPHSEVMKGVIDGQIDIDEYKSDVGKKIKTVNLKLNQLKNMN